MPLHDWNEPAGWDGVLVELLRWIKPRLPEGFRAYIGSTPALTVGALAQRADVAVRQWRPEELQVPQSQQELPADSQAKLDEPDIETATLTLDPQTALYVAAHGRMVAAVELISPRNKDRPSSRAHYLARYLGYLQEGAHLLLVDVHRRPVNFSFADVLAQELQIAQPALPPPLAVTYRVGEPAASGGRLLAIWRRQLVVGAPLPAMPLPLTVHAAIPVNLEETYVRAAADAYLT
jgi:Protein of unknown function (DUF4058)